jgi:hypothetical protein
MMRLSEDRESLQSGPRQFDLDEAGPGWRGPQRHDEAIGPPSLVGQGRDILTVAFQRKRLMMV